jgi:ribosome-binding ATPase YchF (GTP1/OBG family)
MTGTNPEGLEKSVQAEINSRKTALEDQIHLTSDARKEIEAQLSILEGKLRQVQDQKKLLSDEIAVYVQWKPFFRLCNMRPEAGASQEELAKTFRSAFEGAFSAARRQIPVIESLLDSTNDKYIDMPMEARAALTLAWAEMDEFIKEVYKALPKEDADKIRSERDFARNFPELFAKAVSLGGSENGSQLRTLYESFKLHAEKYISSLLEVTQSLKV